MFVVRYSQDTYTHAGIGFKEFIPPSLVSALRWLMLFMNTYFLLVDVYDKKDFWRYFTVFTNWGKNMTELSLIASIYASYYDDLEVEEWRPIIINYKAIANIFC